MKAVISAEFIFAWWCASRGKGWKAANYRKFEHELKLADKYFAVFSELKLIDKDWKCI